MCDDKVLTGVRGKSFEQVYSAIRTQFMYDKGIVILLPNTIRLYSAITQAENLSDVFKLIEDWAVSNNLIQRDSEFDIDLIDSIVNKLAA